LLFGTGTLAGCGNCLLEDNAAETYSAPGQARGSCGNDLVGDDDIEALKDVRPEGVDYRDVNGVPAPGDKDSIRGMLTGGGRLLDGAPPATADRLVGDRLNFGDLVLQLVLPLQRKQPLPLNCRLGARRKE